MRAGIEINAYGAPLAYWIKKTHPGDSFVGAATFAWMAAADDWRRIPTLTPWGRKRVLHIHDKERTGQSRGKPLFSAVMKQFRMLDKYQSSELQAAVINAMIAAFVETPLDQDSMVEMFGGDTDQYLADRNAYIKNRVRLKGGAVMPLYPGDKMSSFSPNRPSDKFAPFVDAMNRHVAASLNMPYELLLKDFSKTNYSSARAALLEAWRFFNGRRKWLSDHWAQPVYELWLEEVVDAGLIDAPGFDEHRRAYARAFWIGPGRGWVDPVKEARAAQIRMDIGVSTLERECAEQGLDWEEVLEQRARERKRMAELDLLDVANVVSSQPFIPDPPNLEETKP
jgi:lambda family phage portal protein